MDNLLQLQYKHVQGARGALFTYLGTMAAADVLKPVPAFNDNNITRLLIHTANTYLHWLVFFDTQQQVDFFNDENIKGLDDIRSVYQMVDERVSAFIGKYQDHNQPISQYTLSGKAVTTTPLQLFTHAITHEFHHKGQLLTMSRMLGYIPADTDVIRT